TLNNPGSRRENCHFVVPSAYSSRLPGRARGSGPETVSYTHLDVYKRQVLRVLSPYP
ncbi:hypothetical protein AZ007_004741, partial [Citrobacter freundii]